MNQSVPFLRLLTFIAATVAAPLAAQNAPAPATAPLATSVDVKVINVDVRVSDHGKSVSNLTRDDFEVLEDGQPQPITNFVQVDAPARGAAAGNALPDPRGYRRRTMLLIDNNYLEKRDRDVALARLDAFIDQAPPDDEWAVGTIGQSLDILLPLTADRTAVHGALARARKVAVSSLRATDEDREILSDTFKRNRGGSAPEFGDSAQFEGRERTTRNARSLAYMANALADGARSASAEEGKKFIVLVTGNIEMNSSFAAFDRASDREMQDTKTTISKLIENVIREANAANITVFVLNAASHSMAAPQHSVENQSFGGANDLATTADVDVSESDSAGTRIALGTGGQYLRSNYVAEALQRIDEQSSHYYSIGYSPGHDDDRKYHRITVRVKRPGLHVSHREGYLDLSPEERLEQLLRLRVSTLQPARAVPVSLRVERAVKPGDAATLSLLASTPYKDLTLLDSARGYAGRVHIYLSVFDGGGKNVGFHHIVQDLVVPATQRTKALADDFRYRMNIRLGRGAYTLAVTMRDELSREIGTAVQSVKM